MKSTLAAAGLLIARVCLGSTGTDDVLRTAKELDALLMSGRNEVRSFELSGQVLHACTSCRKSFFLDDGTNIVRLVDNVYWPDLKLRDGDFIRAKGRTVPQKNHGVNPDCHSIVITGHGERPEPPVTAVRDILRQRGFALRNVRVRGRVRDVVRDDIDHFYASIILTDDDATLTLSLMCEDREIESLKALVGAEVSVSGLIRTDEHFKPTGGNISFHGNRGIHTPLLTVAGPHAIRIEKPAPIDPFDVPELKTLHPIWPEDLATSSRCRTHGLVLTTARPNGFLLRTADGRLVNVDLADGTPPEAGAQVTVAGLPVTDLYRINLTRAIWKQADRDPAFGHVQPEETRIGDLLTDGKGHAQYKISKFGKTLQLSGTVRSLPAPGESEHLVTLEQDGYILSLVANAGDRPFSELALGMTIAVTGICLMDVESWRPGMIFPQITGVRIAVRSPDDIRILSKPSWWTPQRILILAGLFALAALVVGLWNITLRTLVIRRSRALLREQAKRLTETLRVEERTRLATELHDTVAQNLSGLSLQLDAAGRLADGDPVTMKSILAFSSKALLACRRELRDCLWDLRSQALDEADMNAAIRRALAPHLGDAQLITRFNVPRRKLTDHTVHAVLRILGELTGNAVRHGRATTIRIAGSFDDDGLKFSCADNGCGFDVVRTPGSADGHFGLQGIRDRIRTFNGSFKLTSVPGKGTKAIVHLRPTPLET